MSDTLERQLREALTARVQEIPAAAVHRVQSHEYRPRTRDLRPPVAGGALASAAVAGGLVLTLGLGRPAPAFAGWRSQPTHARRNQLTDAAANCTAVLAAAPDSPAPGGPPASARPSLPALDTMTRVVSDTRGPFTFLVYATSDATASCLGGPGFTQPSEYRDAQALPQLAAGTISLVQQSPAVERGRTYTFIDGRVGADVSQVTLRRADGSAVQATVEDGWFAAWWPGSSNATSAVLETSTGTATAALPAPKAAG